MFKNSKLFFWSVEILLISSILFIFSKIGFIFSPINAFLSTLFVPFLIAGFLYYLLNPLVSLLEKFKIARSWAILIVFVILFGGLTWAIVSLIPNLTSQINGLISSMPSIEKNVTKFITQVSGEKWAQNIDFNQYLKGFDFNPSKMISSSINQFTEGIGTVFSRVIGVAVSAIIIPFILFYMLRDGHKFIPTVQKWFSGDNRQEIGDLLKKMNATISRYISGQFIDCFIVGLMTVIGYLIINLPFGLLLGVIGGLTNIIPYLGPYIGLIPAAIVCLALAPDKIIYVIIVAIVVHTIDGNVVYPNVIGKVLNIHPLTILVLLLVAGNMAGLLGMILVVPLYAILVTVVKDLYQIYRLRRGADPKKIVEDAPLQ